jgi:hypothetical protein
MFLLIVEESPCWNQIPNVLTQFVQPWTQTALSGGLRRDGCTHGSSLTDSSVRTYLR